MKKDEKVCVIWSQFYKTNYILHLGRETCKKYGKMISTLCVSFFYLSQIFFLEKYFFKDSIKGGGKNPLSIIIIQE